MGTPASSTFPDVLHNIETLKKKKNVAENAPAVSPTSILSFPLWGTYYHRTQGAEGQVRARPALPRSIPSDPSSPAPLLGFTLPHDLDLCRSCAPTPRSSLYHLSAAASLDYPLCAVAWPCLSPTCSPSEFSRTVCRVVPADVSAQEKSW